MAMVPIYTVVTVLFVTRYNIGVGTMVGLRITKDHVI